MNTLEAFHMRCQRLMYAGGLMSPVQTAWGASAIWFVNHWWHLTSSKLISVWPCCMPGPSRPGVSAHDALRLMVDTYEGRKASWRRPRGRPLNVWLNKIRRIPTLYCYLWVIFWFWCSPSETSWWKIKIKIPSSVYFKLLLRPLKMQRRILVLYFIQNWFHHTML